METVGGVVGVVGGGEVLMEGEGEREGGGGVVVAAVLDMMRCD